MPTPPKPFTVLTTENKSHRTKAELNLRKKGEEALSTESPIKVKKEVKENEIAYKEFKRILKLLKGIKKADAIYENVINRYCLMYAETISMVKQRETFTRRLDQLEEYYSRLENQEDMEFKEYIKLSTDLEKSIIETDKQIQVKRKMLLDIEKENVMTIASALRSIPKKPEEADNPLIRALRGG